jgi:hypothetical protein
MEVIRTPALRYKDGEPSEDYQARVHRDVMARPGHYFIGLNRRNDPLRFGSAFLRDEFDLEELKARYRDIAEEIDRVAEREAWYKNHFACNLFGYPCQFLPVCEHGVASNEVFERPKQEESQ